MTHDPPRTPPHGTDWRGAHSGGADPGGRAAGRASADPHPADAPAQAFLVAEVREARRRIEELDRETATLRRAFGSQQQLADELRTALATLEGRTRRHERGQDAASDLRSEVAALTERLEAEVGLRRDHGAAAGEEQRRERELVTALEERLATLGARLQAVEERLAGEAERRQHLVQQLLHHDTDGRAVGERIVDLERRLAALADQRRADGDEQARMAVHLGALVDRVAALVAQQEAHAQVQRRLDDEVAALRTVRDRERDLAEAIELTRAARHRFDERLAEQEREMTALRAVIREAHDDRALTRQQAQAAEQRTRELADVIEEHRWSMLEHLRRVARLADEQTRRDLDEIRRRNRMQREVFARFADADEPPGAPPAAAAGDAAVDSGGDGAGHPRGGAPR